MTRVQLESVLRVAASEIVADSDQTWELVVHEVTMHAFCNVAKDRMRIMAEVTSATDMSPEELANALRADFQLEARYAIADDVLYAVFIHELSTLTATLLRSALYQVAELVQTYGSTYSSGPMRFEMDRDYALGRSTLRRRTEESVEEHIARTKRRPQD